MSCGVGVLEGVVPCVGVAVEVLWIRGAGNDGVRREEPPQLRIVVSGLVEVESGLWVEFFAGELVGNINTFGGEELSVGGILVVGDLGTLGVGNEVGGA